MSLNLSVSDLVIYLETHAEKNAVRAYTEVPNWIFPQEHQSSFVPVFVENNQLRTRS